MGLAPLTIPGIKIQWFKAPCLDYHTWSQAAQRLWEFLLDLKQGGRMRFDYRDWELAQLMGVGRRCVQKALWYLEHVVGVIRRFRRWGHDGRRIIEIEINLAGRAAKAAPAPAMPSTAKQAPTAEPDAPPGAAAVPEPEPELTADDIAAAEAFRARGRELAKKHADEEAARKARVTAQRLGIAPPPARDTRKEAETQKAALDAWLASRPAADAPKPDPRE